MAEAVARGGSAVFTVRLDGLALPDEVNARIAGAVRRAVLIELADLDLRTGVHITDLAAEDRGGGGPQGIAIVAEIARGDG